MNLEKLLQAFSFAARAHQGQTRKDGQTPYAAHPSRVCLIVRHVFGFDEPDILAAAALHDTIEDTTTDYDDILEQFGPSVADWVRAMTKDKRLEETRREKEYIDQILQADWQVHIIKLADILDNSMDSKHLDETRKKKAMARYDQYLQAISTIQEPKTRQAVEKMNKILTELKAAGN